MASGKQLFRKEAIESKRAKSLGSIILIQPLSFTLLTVSSAVMTLMLLTFLVVGSYTKRSTSLGQLAPISGQLKIYTHQAGIIVEKHVEEGQSIERGAPLLTISSERYGSNLEPVQAGLSDKLRLQYTSLTEEAERKKLLQVDELKTQRSSVSSLKNELHSMSAQISNQRELVGLASDAVSRYSGLFKKGYISKDEFQQKQFELLSQKKIQQHLERQRAELQQKLAEHQAELGSLSAKHENQLASIQRLLANVEQQLSENEARRTFVIRAPDAGIVTAIMISAGQAVDSSRLLLSIIPMNSKLQAELYVPSKSIGFIRIEDEVLIRYHAYPYQKFGLHAGKVQSISRTTLSPSELVTVGASVAVSQHGEQLYRVLVNINEQEIVAYGEKRQLQAGMLVEADIFQERRNLYEWLLEPVYSITERL